MELLKTWRTPTILRTVISKLNYKKVSDIGRLLEPMENIVRWSLLEFSAVGEGYTNREKYEIGRDLFEGVAAHIQSTFRGKALIDVYRSEAKIGTYALITPAGFVYGTSNSTIDGMFPVSGSILHDHLCDIAKALPFSKERHLQRYSSLPML